MPRGCVRGGMQVICAVTLRDLLQQAVLGDINEFEAEMHQHAQACLGAIPFDLGPACFSRKAAQRKRRAYSQVSM